MRRREGEGKRMGEGGIGRGSKWRKEGRSEEENGGRNERGSEREKGRANES